MCKICGEPRSKHLRHWTEVKEHDRFNKEVDMMPDGIHAKLYKFWDYNKSNLNVSLKNPYSTVATVVRPFQTREERDSSKAELMAKWLELPEPRPDYFEWGCREYQAEVLESLRDTAINGRKIGDRIKASDIMLKHGKTPPKQTLKLEGKDAEVDVEDLFKKLLEVIPKERISELMNQKVQ